MPPSPGVCADGTANLGLLVLLETLELDFPSDDTGAARAAAPGSGDAMNEWMTVEDAARHAKCGTRSIYVAVRNGTLRAARLGGRRELRFLAEWIDAWLIASSTPEIVNPHAPGAPIVDSRGLANR